jgi:bifunctional non-homologous end joining protein LigD
MSGLPEWLEPMAATLTQERFGPERADWIFEHKIDGIRLIAFRDGADVRLYSRNRIRQDIPAIEGAIAALPVRDVILDGEVDWDQRRYHVFDILWRDGRDLRGLPLEERLAELDALPLVAPLGRVEVVRDAEPWERARAEGWEGVIAKRRGSPYEHRRSPHWLKMKIEATQELVVGGFTEPRGKRVGLGALLVGYFDGADLVFAGKVGTGLDTAMLLDLRARLGAMEIEAAPFTRAVGLPRERIHWVRPELVVQVAFMEWTGHDKLRHPRLVGLRADKAARDVVRETPGDGR